MLQLAFFGDYIINWNVVNGLKTVSGRLHYRRMRLVEMLIKVTRLYVVVRTTPERDHDVQRTTA